jgi:hypothetical protein
MKKLFILTAVIAASLVANKSNAQVFVSAHVGLRVPAPRLYVAAPAPVYVDGYYAVRDHRAYFYGGHFDHARFTHDRGFHRGRW